MATGDYRCNCGMAFTESQMRDAHSSSCKFMKLEAENAKLLLQNRELLMALGRAHDPGRCPYNSYGKCWACVALKKYGDQMPDQHLAVCSVCKELIEDTFAARKAARCEKCEGYSHNNCWAAHNLTYCLKRNNETCLCAAKADPRDVVMCPLHG